MALLPTNAKTGDPLTAKMLNDVGTAVNANTADVAVVSTNVAATSNSLAAAQTVTNANQSALVTVNQTTNTQGAAITNLLAAITAAQGRLTVLENVTPPPSTPNKPTGLTPGTITTTSVVLSWTAPAAGTAPTSYQTRYAPAGSGAWVNGPLVTAPTVTATYTGLTQATNYDLDVVPRSAGGPGAVSDTLTVKTLSPFTPSPDWFEIPKDGSTITLNDGRLVTILGGVIQLDGVAMANTNSVILVLKAPGGLIYQENSSINWWYWDPTKSPVAWVFSSDPRGGPTSGSPKAKMLAYLNSISGNHVLSGQTSDSNRDSYDVDTAALGFEVAVAFFDPYLHQWAGNYIYDPSFVATAISMWNGGHGNIIGVSLILPTPGGGSAYDGIYVDPVQVVTSGTALNNSLVGFLSQVATDILIPFKNAGMPVLLRYMMEPDGGWFWYGVNNFSGSQQTQLFRFIRAYFDGRGCDNALHTFAVNMGPGSYQYPGDDVVDIVGMDMYTNDPAGVYGSHYDALRAQAPTKIIAATEWGSGGPGANEPLFNTQTLIDAVKSRMPRLVYLNAWWKLWPWALETNARGGLSDPYVINKAQVVLPP